LFDQGTFSYVFKAFDVGKEQWFVIKIPKEEFKDEKKKKEDTYSKIHTSLYTCHMTRLFRQCCADIPEAPPIFFLQPILCKLDLPFYGERFVYAEPFLNLQNLDWKKYTNNHAFCINEAFASFSHFSLVFSGNLFLVSDLQGKDSILTDPAIHTLDSHKMFPEKSNLKEQGILAFFEY